MATMVLGGLWHGANLTFVVWGALHGLALVVQRLWSAVPRVRAPGRGPLASLAGWALTLSWVVVCFALFRCESVDMFLLLLSKLAETEPAARVDDAWWLLIAMLGAVHLAIHRLRPQLERFADKLPGPVYYFGLGAAISLAMFFTPIRNTPFIYFQF